MKAALVCIGTILMLAACITINDKRPNTSDAQQATEAPQIRGALSGQKQLIGSFYATAPNCTSLGYPTLKVSQPPQHGQVSVEQGTAIADFGINDARARCNGESVPATTIYYTSETGFTGADSVAFERIGVAGAYGYHAYTINVR